MASFSPTRQPTARETAASIGVLLVLGLVAAWLLVTQSHFSPAVTVAVTAARTAEAAKPVKAPAEKQAPESTAPAPPPSAAAPADLFASWPASLRAMSPAESFTAETLSDKIDGKAELYLSANVVGLRCQRVAAPADAWFEAFIYDMGKPENAFAVYSSQKRTATQDIAIGDYSYRAGNQICVVHGRYYLEFVGADDAEPTAQAAATLARAFVTMTAVSRHADMTKDESLFPPEALVPGTLMLMSADVFGFDQLNNTYVARYREGKDTVTLFLSRRASAAEAGQLAAAVRGFFVNDCGGTEAPAPPSPPGAVVVDSGGSFDGVFAAREFVAGVHQAPSREAAAQWMQRLSAQLQTSKR